MNNTLGNLIEGMPFPAFIKDSSGRYLAVNKAFRDFYGKSKENFIGKTAKQIFPGEQGQNFDDQDKLTIEKTGTQEIITFRTDSKGVSHRIILSKTVFPVLNQNGIFGIYVDLTESDRVKADLHQQNEWFNRAFYDSPIAMLMADFSNGKIIFCNEAFSKISGYPLSDLIGRTTLELSLWESETVRKSWHDQVKKNRKVSDFEFKFKTKSGQSRYVLSSSSLTNCDDILCSITTIRDITDYKTIHDKLEKQVSLLKSVLEATASAILVIDTNGKVSTYNQKFVELWEIPKKILDTGQDQELLAYSINKIKDPEEFMIAIKYLYEHPTLEEHALINLKDGKIVSQYSCPQKNGDKIIGRVWSFTDVTMTEKAKESIMKSEMRFKVLFNSLQEIISVTNRAIQFDETGYIDEPGIRPLDKIKEETERRHIEDALRRTRGMVLPAARLLQMSRYILMRRIKKLGIEVHTFK